jgi:hypothetical protein
MNKICPRLQQVPKTQHQENKKTKKTEVHLNGPFLNKSRISPSSKKEKRE